MPRTKELKINASELGCYSQMVAELNKNPLLADYDLSTIELKVKHNKPKPILKKDLSELINNLLRYQSANRECIPTLDGVQLINKQLLARMLNFPFSLWGQLSNILSPTKAVANNTDRLQ